MRGPALLTRNLACGYGGQPVVSAVNLCVAPHDIVALLGPNGSGKSTLLRSLCGLLSPIAGDVELMGTPIATLSSREVAKRVAVVPPEENVEFPFTVAEIVAMGRLPHSEGLFDTAEDRRAGVDAMREAGCLELANRPISHVSAGERQRVLLARALAQNAPILLLDEPTSHLDAAHQVSFASLMRALAARGLAIVAALHDLNLAAQVAGRAVVLSGGRVACEGSTDAILGGSHLDSAFGVEFERTRGADGNFRLHPRYGA